MNDDGKLLCDKLLKNIEQHHKNIHHEIFDNHINFLYGKNPIFGIIPYGGRLHITLNTEIDKLYPNKDITENTLHRGTGKYKYILNETKDIPLVVKYVGQIISSKKERLCA